MESKAGFSHLVAEVFRLAKHFKAKQKRKLVTLGRQKTDVIQKKKHIYIWVFPKIVVSQNGWFIMEHPIKMGLFGGTPIFGNIHIYIYPLGLVYTRELMSQKGF